nr:uncharacterized mitochondrial protein AtMg00810-like [Tanacetum cinerariifolium]
IAPIAEVIPQVDADSTGSPSLTTIDQDVPSPRLQISQSPRGIFIKQSKYALESLKKYGFESCNPVDTLMVEKSKLDEDTKGKAVDPSHYHGMIGTLLYLTASRHDLQFAICMCARYQARLPKSTSMQSKGSFDTFVEPFIRVVTLHKKLSINQECQDLRSNPSKDRDIDIRGDQKLKTSTLGEIVSLEKSNKNV